MVWPYGAHNLATDEIASDLGMSYGLTLELGFNTPDVPLSRMRRILITHDFTGGDFAQAMERPINPEPMRVIQVDLDFVYDPDPQQQEANLSALLDRVKAMGVNTVFLQALPIQRGAAPQPHCTSRTGACPCAPTSSTECLGSLEHAPESLSTLGSRCWPTSARSDPAHDHWVLANEAAKAGDVKRLSPFDLLARQAVRDIYQDLSTYTSFQGLLFSDDATLIDFEDASPAALAIYHEWGLPADVTMIPRELGLLCNLDPQEDCLFNAILPRARSFGESRPRQSLDRTEHLRGNCHQSTI